MIVFDHLPRFLTALAVMFLFPLATAHAEPDPTEEVDDQALALEFYEQASQAYGDGEYDRAAEFLEQAYQHDPDLIYRYNQILALYGLGNYEAALGLLEDYRQAMIDDERFDDIDELHEELEESHAALAELEAQREQEEAAARQEVEPLPDEALEPPSNKVAWALIGAGGASLGAGLFFGSGYLVRDHIDRVEASRTPEDEQQVYSGISFERQDDLDNIRNQQILTISFLTAGALLGGTGAVLLWRGRSDAGVDDGPTLGLHLTPGGALLRGTF